MQRSLSCLNEPRRAEEWSPPPMYRGIPTREGERTCKQTVHKSLLYHRLFRNIKS
jgi:hypothetical protein